MGAAIVFLVGSLFIIGAGIATKMDIAILLGMISSIFWAWIISILRRPAINEKRKVSETTGTEKPQLEVPPPGNKDAELSQQGLLYCRYCGKMIERDSVFCKHCGRSQNKEGLRAFLRGNKRRAIVAGLLVVVLVICAFVIPAEIIRQEKIRLIESGMVYVARTGTKYHLYEDCSGMFEPKEMTEDLARRQDKKRCTKCYEGVEDY